MSGIIYLLITFVTMDENSEIIGQSKIAAEFKRSDIGDDWDCYFEPEVRKRYYDLMETADCSLGHIAHVEEIENIWVFGKV